MRWLREHKIASLLIAALLIAAILLGITFTAGSRGTGIFGRIYTTIEKPMTRLGAAIKKNVTGLFSYRDLMAENEDLKEENSKLREQINQLTLSANELKALEDLSKALNYDFIKGETDIVTADVVSLDGVNWTNAFTIDRGSESGIAADDIVIAGEGLIGRVSETGKGWSKVIPIIDESSHISFSLNSNRNILGIIKGAENGELTGYMLDSSSDINEGELIVTSGMGKYPAGICIGRVSSAVYDSDRQLMEIKVKPLVDFASLAKVSVIL